MSRNNKNNSAFHGVTCFALSIAVFFACPVTIAQAQSPIPGNIVETAETVEKPILIVRFSQKNVYFANALKTVVDAVNKTNAKASYAVESITPGNVRQNEYTTAQFTKNLKAVVAELNKLGVPVGNISVKESKSTAISSQEIHLFVHN